MPVEYRQHRYRLPPGATEVVLVRHGESALFREHEPFRLTDGHGDPELGPEGRWQAERVGDRLARERIDAIYVTTLRRTVETAAPLAGRLGITPAVEPGLREVHLGDWEGGMYRIKAAEADPVFVRMMTEERWEVVPGAEADNALHARTRAAILRIVAAHPDQRVAVFLHSGTIASLLHQATGSRPFAFIGSDNASISHLVIHGERWTLRRFNDTGHLDELSEEGEPPI